MVTDRASVGSVATFMGRMLMKETAQRVILHRGFKWRRVQDLPKVKVNYVDYKEILEKNKPFSKRLIAVQAQSKDNKTVEEDKYLAELFYIAPIYHLGFSALDKLLVIDGTDLEFHDDIKLLYDQFKHVTNGKLIGLGLDLSPNYYNQLNNYRTINPTDPAGMPGETQGFNTGVVLYNLEAMRRSALYNRYISPAMVDMMIRKFQYDFTLAEQDWFTSLSFLHPDLFYVLPCKFNRQTSIQYLQPPWEQIFESFHECDPKLDVMVYHSNGCGPQPQACGVIPGSVNYTGTYWINRTRYWKDIHMDFDYFWQALAGLDY